MKRREFLKDAAFAAGAVAAGTVHAEGKVRTGRVTGGGRPLRGVMVTDGLGCVLTGADGRWRLPFRDAARFVTVTVPSGWRIDRHYIPLSGHAGDLDFALVPWAPSAGKGCSFVHVGDSEIGSTSEVRSGWVQVVKELVSESKASFVVHTGDICRERGLEAHHQVLNRQTVDAPVFWCLGNHDLVPCGKCGEEMFESLYGPCWFSFEAGGVHFCVTPMRGGDARPSYTHDEVAAWMKNDLALIPKGMPVVVFNHTLPDAGSQTRSGFRIGAKKMFDYGKACNLTGVVYGHVHYNYVRRSGNATFITTAPPNKGGIDHSPAALRVVSADAEGRLSSTLHYWPQRKWNISSAGADWETKLPGPVLFSTPVVSGGRLFVGTADDAAGVGTVTAVDCATGRVAWSRRTVNSVNSAVAVAEGKVFANDLDGNVYAFSQKDGAEVWRASVPKTMDSWRACKGGTVFDPETRCVFAGNGGRRLAAFNAGDGSVRWSGVKWKRETEPCVALPAVGGGVLVASAQWSGLHGHDAATGKHLWFRDGKTFFHLGPQPLIVGDKVYALCRTSFYELDLRTGKTLREKVLQGSGETATGILMTDRHFIFGTIRDGLFALDRSTFEVAWRMDVGAALVVNAPYCRSSVRAISSAPVRISAELGALAANDGSIHVFRLEDGRSVRRIATGAPYLCAPAIADGKMYSADCAGFLRSHGIS